MRLAIIGASARAAAHSALSAGFDVVAADLFADADLAARCPTTRIDHWPEGFGHWLATTQCDGWMITGGLENYPDLVDEWSMIKRLFGADGATLRFLRDPEWLAGVLAPVDLSFPTTYKSLPSEPLTGHWLVKRLRSSGGWGVGPWQPGGTIAPGEEILQQRIEGTPFSAVYVASAGTAVCWGVTRQLIAPPWSHATGFKYAGSIGPLALSIEALAQVKKAGTAVARASGIVGVWGIDFVLDNEGIAWVIEVNPRYTASMEVIERATGHSAIGLHFAAFGDRVQLPPATQPDKSWGKAYLFAPRDVCPGPGFTRHLERLATAGHAADIPHPSAPISKGMPVTTLLARGANGDEVEDALEAGLQDLTSRLMASEPSPTGPIFAAGETRP